MDFCGCLASSQYQIPTAANPVFGSVRLGSELRRIAMWKFHHCICYSNPYKMPYPKDCPSKYSFPKPEKTVIALKISLLSQRTENKHDLLQAHREL